MRLCAWYYVSYSIQQNCQMHFVVCSLVSSQEGLKYTPSWAPWHTHSLHEYTLPSKRSECARAHSRVRTLIHSQLHSISHSWPVSLYASKKALKILSGTLPSTPPITLSRGKTLPISLGYMLPSMLLRDRFRVLQSCRHQALGGKWREADGGRRVAAADMMPLVNIIVWTLCLLRPPRRDLTMPHCQGVDNCSLTSRRIGRKLSLGEGGCPTQISSGICSPRPTDCRRMCKHLVPGWWWLWEWW